MNEITKILAEKLSNKLGGVLKYDDSCGIFRISTSDIYVCIKDADSDWNNYSEVGENVVCAESKEAFNKWSQCMYVEVFPIDDNGIDRMVKNINLLTGEGKSILEPMCFNCSNLECK